MTSSTKKAHAYYEKGKDREAKPQVKGEASGTIDKAYIITIFNSKLMMVRWDVGVTTSDS